MITLSKSLTNNKTYEVFAIVGRQRYLTSFTHPGEAETPDSQAYKAYLWAHMQQPHSSIAKELAKLAKLHRSGQRIVIVVHENTHHGEVIVAAIKYLANTLKPTPRAHATAPHAGLPTWQENAADHDLIDERRFVWVASRDGEVAHLAYVWDTEGVVTALVPEFGLVKLGRLPNHFWVQRALGQLTPRVHTAKVKLSRAVERTFVPLIKQQMSNERIETAADDRYQPWALCEEESAFAEEPSGEELEAELEAESFFHLYATLQPDDWANAEPSKYSGPHVKPVIKTKADGSRWELTPHMQARGALHLYQPLS